MQIAIDPALTVVAILVLLLGRALCNRIGPLRAYSIPEPVVGGLVDEELLTGLARLAARGRRCRPGATAVIMGQCLAGRATFRVH